MPDPVSVLRLSAVAAGVEGNQVSGAGTAPFVTLLVFHTSCFLNFNYEMAAC